MTVYNVKVVYRPRPTAKREYYRVNSQTKDEALSTANRMFFHQYGKNDVEVLSMVATPDEPQESWYMKSVRDKGPLPSWPITAPDDLPPGYWAGPPEEDPPLSRAGLWGRRTGVVVGHAIPIGVAYAIMGLRGIAAVMVLFAVYYWAKFIWKAHSND